MAANVVNNKYRITLRIGGGSFGEIYMGIGPSNERVAVKFERHATRCPQLRHEYKVYRELAGCHGFCRVYHFGQQDSFNVMVMDLLGPSLEDLFNKCNRRFSLKTVLQIADQMLERVETLHARHLIHRDIKPANFVIGSGNQSATIFCVDFGLSKRYRHPKTLQHIPHRDGRSLTGTPRYASINNHLGVEQSRRDDLESIGYVLIYFLKGSLPWQGLKAKNAQKKYRLILEKKQQVSIAQLCQGCPSQFAEFLAYTRSLKFDAKPDISYLRKLFRDLYHNQNCAAQMTKLWDWDGMENDFGSVAGSTNGTGVEELPGTGVTGEVAVSGAPQMMSSTNMRPTTAAAVANPGEDSGYGGYDDLDMGMMNPRRDRPNTAGAMMMPGNGAPVMNNRPPVHNSHQWGFGQNLAQPMTSAASGQMSSQGQVSGSNPLNGNRRPHTAHGRSGTAPNAVLGEQEDVVSHVRDLMRYRRTRTSGDGGQPGSNPGVAMNGAPPHMGGHMGNGSAPMNGYIPNGYMMNGSQQVAATGSGGMRKPMAGAQPGASAAGGQWGMSSMDSRPKSATGLTGGQWTSPAQGNAGMSNGMSMVVASGMNRNYGAVKMNMVQSSSRVGSSQVNGAHMHAGHGVGKSSSGKVLPMGLQK